jgi:hypothetical protein
MDSEQIARSRLQAQIQIRLTRARDRMEKTGAPALMGFCATLMLVLLHPTLDGVADALAAVAGCSTTLKAAEHFTAQGLCNGYRAVSDVLQGNERMKAFQKLSSRAFATSLKLGLLTAGTAGAGLKMLSNSLDMEGAAARVHRAAGVVVALAGICGMGMHWATAHGRFRAMGKTSELADKEGYRGFKYGDGPVTFDGNATARHDFDAVKNRAETKPDSKEKRRDSRPPEP